MLTSYLKFIKQTFIVLVVLLMLTSMLGMLSPVPTGQITSAPAMSKLLHFTAGGHVLGFTPNKVYLAGLDHVLTIDFVGGNGTQPVRKAGSGAQNGDIALLNQITYKSIWPGIDVVYTAVKGGIAESVYLLAPGAEVKSIHLKYNAPLKLVNNGLQFSFENGFIAEGAPVAWQEIHGKRVSVDVSFTLSGRNEVGFALGRYDSAYGVTIDPAYSWHTFYGSTGSDRGSDITLDESGNVYVTGMSDAAWNGPGGESPLNAYSGSGNVFVVKMNNAGQYQWHTFYGSTTTGGDSIKVGGGGNIYVTGISSATWNGPSGIPPLNPYNNFKDVFALKLNSAGAYQWHTFYGGSDDGSGGSAVDLNGNLYLTGDSNAPWNGPGGATPLNAYSGNINIFVVKLGNGGAYQWHTFYGPESVTFDMALDGNNNIYLTGYGYSSWNGPAGQQPLNAFANGANNNIVVVKLNSAGSYQWHTFYGSAVGSNWGLGITADSSGNSYITGFSVGESWNGPVGQLPLNAFGNGENTFALKLNGSGGYQWHTFYSPGLYADNDGTDIAVDESGNIYVTGQTAGTWNGPGGIAPLNPYNSGYDMFALKLNGAGTYQWHTFYGSSDNEYGSGIVLDKNNSFYLTGFSAATWNGPGGTPPLHAYSGGSSDIVIIKLGNPPIFTDVPDSYWAGSYIERLYKAGITGGCTTVPLAYCPDSTVTRAQMAVFLLKGMHGSSFAPPAVGISTGFNDVPTNYWAAAWIKQLAAEGITGGCGSGNYCPDATVTRAQMAVFLLKAKHGSSYSPPTATGVFSDVPVGYWADKWIEQLASEGITGGCGTDLYCPDAEVTRAQMAVFLVKAFNLP